MGGSRSRQSIVVVGTAVGIVASLLVSTPVLAMLGVLLAPARSMPQLLQLSRLV